MAKSKTKKSRKGPRPLIDEFGPAATENTYYISHNIQDALFNHGAKWPEAKTFPAKKLKEPQYVNPKTKKK